MRMQSIVTKMLSDWSTITPSRDPGSLNVLRADSSHPLHFRIGRDARGRYVFQLDSERGVDDAPLNEPPAGMDVVGDDLGGGVSRLTLTLHDEEDFAIFRVLCSDLLDVTRGFGEGEGARGRRILLNRLRQWQEVFARRRRKLLSRNEIMGLVGELLFLRDIMGRRFGLPLAVASWRGPYGDEQDFAISDLIVEVKTQGTTADRRLRVSSEDQLETAGSRIVICQQGVAACDKREPGAASLNGLARELSTASEEMPECRARLAIGLDTAGWQDLPEYDDHWMLMDRNYFEVIEGFPRITRADLRSGVEEVRYRIRVADCLPFRIEEEAVFGGTSG